MKKYAFLALVLTQACGTPESRVDDAPEKEVKQEAMQVDTIDLGTQEHFRGIEIPDEQTVWISGTGNTYGKSTDKGQTWVLDTVATGRQLDFRSLHAFDAQTALLVSAGFPGKIYRTENGGEAWEEVYSNMDSAIFLDGIAFWNQDQGLVFGDPLDGKLMLLRTEDGGKSWSRIGQESLPEPLDPEAGFAASGTSMVLKGDGKVWIGLGGLKARVFYSEDYGDHWTAVETPMLHGDMNSGIFSVSFWDEEHGVAVGGDWRDDHAPKAKMYTTDGGKNWTLAEGKQEGFQSGVAYRDAMQVVSTGTSGTDMSFDGGRSWQFMDSVGLNGVDFFDAQTGIGMGSYGLVVKFHVP